MKKLLLLLLFSICTVSWFSEPLMKNLGILKTAAVPVSDLLPKSNFIVPDPVPVAHKQANCMSLTDYAQQANHDRNAYYKLLNCTQAEQERTEADKLMNFFARLKYE